MTAFDRDELIRLALTPDASVRAPIDLGDDILRAVTATPQHRRLIPLLPVVRWLPTRSPAAILAVLLALLLLIGAVLVLANRPPPTPLDLLLYHGGPGRTGVLPGPGPRGIPVVLWTEDLTGPVPVTTMPVVIDRTVYVADESGAVWAFDTTTGEKRAPAIELGSPVTSPPAVVQDILVVAADDGDVTAIDRSTFKVRWDVHVSDEAIRGALLAVGDRIYAAGVDGTLYTLDAGGAIVGRTSIGGAMGRGPAFANGVLYVGTDQGMVAAVDEASGAVVWRIDLGPGNIGTPSVVGDTLYLARGLHDPAAPHEIVALGTHDHEQRWTFGSPAGAEILAGAATETRVYAVAKDGYVYGLDANGETRWSTDTGAPSGALAGLVDGVLYVTNDRREVLAIDAATGAIRWRIPVAGVPTMAAVIDGRVIVATSLGKVVALGDATGASPAAP
jgi:outer membrane protein assembly factor BamB